MPKKRLRVLLFLVLFIFVIVAARLVQLQVVDYKFYKSKAEGQRKRIIPLASPRGDIYDRNGRVLATSIDTFSVYVNPQKFKDFQLLSKMIGEKIPEFPKTNRHVFAWVKRKMDRAIAEKIMALKIPEVYFQIEKKRVYPKITLASQVVGFVGLDNEGLSGVERSMDDYLRGEEVNIVTESDPAGYELLTKRESKKKKSLAGMDVYLTIDETIQYIAERELALIMKQYSGLHGLIIVMDSKNGEILALAGKPDFDPNKYYKYDSKVWRSKSVDVYEPGSTFKTITMASGLDTKTITLDTKLKALHKLEIGGKTIENSHTINFGGSTISVSKMLEQSVNTAVAQIGIMMGKDRFYNEIRKFGFGDYLDFGLPGESRGIVNPPDAWYAPDIAMISFGQSIAVTPIQLCAAYACFANKGMLIRPQLIRKIESDDQSFVKTSRYEEIRRAISENAAKDTMTVLENVVLNGSGRKAKIDYFHVGGKTGTAQKANLSGRGYMKDHYISSFIGIAPLSDPRIVALVLVDDPKGCIWGETVAGPAFKRVVEETLRYLNVKPDVL